MRYIRVLQLLQKGADVSLRARRAPLSKRVYTHCDPARARISAEGGTAARQIRNFGFFQEKGDIAAFFREKSPFLFEKEI